MKSILYTVIFSFCCCLLSAQDIFIDRPMEAGGLIVFPHIKDTTQFYYLPNKIKLGKSESGKTQFSFLRYVENENQAAGSGSINEGKGGGLVHALVELKVEESQIERAQEELQEKFGIEEALIVGPVIYTGGQFSLVSSFAKEGSDFTKQVLGIGQAPVFVGNKAAVSLSLTKLGAKILWESCQTPTPDLSFSFVMDMKGYTSPINAKIIVNWDKVYTHHKFDLSVGVNIPGKVAIGADIGAAFDELREDGTIKVINFGADEQMEQLIEIAYKKLADMMFAPFSMPKGSQKGAVDKIVDGARSLAPIVGQLKNGLAPVSVRAAYTYKKQKKSGMYTIDLSKAKKESISIRFDENLGGNVAQCADCFTQINLDDPFYKQREVLVSIDGLNSDQFSKYINFVTVSMKKEHGNDESTLAEIRIAENEFKAALGNPFRLLYGWKDEADNDRDEWLKYRYKTSWSFFGDYNIEGEWSESDQVGLNLAPPFHPVQVSVEADPEMLKDAEIRLATVKFYYDYGAGEKVEQVTIKGNQELPADLAEFMLRRGEYDYEYEINWRLFGNRRLTTGRKKSSDSLLYVDEIPKDATEIN